VSGPVGEAPNRWNVSARRRTVHPSEAEHLIGTEVFVTGWRTVDRQHLDGFHWSVDETEDASDVSANELFPRAADNVDGFMLTALITSAFFNHYPVGGDELVSWNYGTDRVRYPATVYLEDEIRLRVTLASVDTRSAGWLLRNSVVMDLRGNERPAMVGDFLVMMTPVA
jgi:acyl dehydratase